MNLKKTLKGISVLLVLLSISTFTYSQAPSQSNAVMMQGFYWDSNATTSWTKLYDISGELSGNFDIIWLPPSAFSSGGTGYMPKQWSNQNSAWGTHTALTKLINALKANSCRPMADVVVNHRDGMSSWVDFYEDDFGTYGKYQFNKSHICRTDEAVARGHMTASEGGAADTGDDFDGARDLDHTSTYVQNAVKAYLQWMKNVVGYDGWRYDMVKGFSGSYINSYNAAGGAYISVGEYWDGSYDAVWAWINATGKTSTAFDFPMKYAALNNGLASGNYSSMAWMDGSVSRPAGLIHSAQSRRYAVTFVDNHDTYRDGSKYTGDVLKANAYILSAPGIPCVFYPHWRDHKTAINAMIKARKTVGLHNESNVTVQNTAGYYKAHSVGNCGEMITYIGSSESSWASDAPSGGGWTKACSGTGWAMYTKVTSTSCGDEFQAKLDKGTNPSGSGDTNPVGTITVKVKVPASWTNAKAWIWDANNTATNYTGGVWPGAEMQSVGGNVYSITVNNVTATEVGVVVNNGGTTPTEQTIDLFTQGDVCWKLGDTPVIIATPKKYDATVDEGCFTSVNVPQHQHIAIYPNPVSNSFRIMNDGTIADAAIYSLNGELLMQINQLENVNISHFPAGVYLLRLSDNQHNQTIRKLVKQ